MVPFSYTLSEPLKAALQKTDSLRVQILITPVTPKSELKMRWEAMLDRIYYTLILDQASVQKRMLVELLTTTPLIRKHKRHTPEEKQILRFKQGLDLLTQDWLVTDKSVTYKTAISLHDYSCPGKYRKGESELKQLCTYMETNPDHPVIQAAVVYACIRRIRPFTDGNGRIASLLSLLFLYKAGYDCRGLISFEKEWLNQPVVFQEKFNLGMNSAYMTGWIEFVAESMAVHLEKKLQDIKNPQAMTEKSKTFYDLNKRQQGILSILSEPGIKITNRDVQKQFKISQITASRDLTHLALLGLIVPHGHGRSIYYTKL